MPKLTDDEFRTQVTRIVAQGGWSTISSLVDMIPIEDLKDEYYWLDEDPEYEEDDNQDDGTK